ncbi:MAG: hypothetical protein ACKO27_06850 [Ilumatobacteraceae bacterium]
MRSRPTGDESSLIELEMAGSTHDGRRHEGGRTDAEGVEWPVVVIATLAVVALASLTVIGVSRDAIDPLATSPTSAATSEFLAVDPTEVTSPVQTGWPSTTAMLPAEGFAWPSDSVVIVANETGIHRVSAAVGAAEGVLVATSLLLGSTVVETIIGDAVTRAFELEDGSLVYQPVDGPIRLRTPDGTITDLVPQLGGLVLEDADMPGADPARLRLVYREPSNEPGGAFYLTVRAGDTTVSTLVPGGWGVSYRRFTLWTSNSVLASWVDDVGTTGAAVIDLLSGQFESDQSGVTVLQAAGDPSEGGLAWVTLEGIWTPLASGPRGLPGILAVTGVDLRGSSLVVQRYGDALADYVDLEPYRRYEVPVRGFASVSRFVHSPRFESPWGSADPGPRTCMLGLPGNDSHVAPYPDDLTAEQIAASEVATVDGFAALIFTMDDGSFVVRITFDVCVLHVRASGIDREQLGNLLISADVGHVVTSYDGDSALDGGTAPITVPDDAAYTTVPSSP